MYQPSGGFPPVAVRPSEVAIVGIVLCVWASAVYVFFNQWGKLHDLKVDMNLPELVNAELDFIWRYDIYGITCRWL